MAELFMDWWRRIRVQREMTQEQLAERSGFPQQYISDLERGRRNPTIVTLFELAQVLGTSPEVLITDAVGDAA
jgi:transcriptional regulator with XRE-family HTH domain